MEVKVDTLVVVSRWNLRFWGAAQDQMSAWNKGRLRPGLPHRVMRYISNILFMLHFILSPQTRDVLFP